MKKLYLLFNFLLGILLDMFKGAVDEIPVLAGLDAIVKQDGKTIAYATGVDFDEDFGLQPILTLGKHGPRGFKSTNYSCSFNVASFVLSGKNIDGAVSIPDRASILTKLPVDFEIIDLATNKTLYIAQGAKCGGAATNFSATELATKSSRWMCMNLKPMAVS
jgi:hypothetical protein